MVSEYRKFLYDANDDHLRVKHKRKDDILKHMSLTPDILVWCDISYSSQTPLVFGERQLNRATDIQDIAKLILLPFLQQECSELF